MADLDRVREALRASMTAWATLEVRGNQARVHPAPDLDHLAAQLETIDPSWGVAWACDSVQPFVVRVRLSVAGTSREGLASAQSLSEAKLAALSEMARMYGFIPPSEGTWVEYDPEEGPNTSDLEAESGLTTSSSDAAPKLPPEPPRDPQMEKARRHIEDLLEQLKAAGKASAAARILMRGYGETLDESRAIYKELAAILKS